MQETEYETWEIEDYVVEAARQPFTSNRHVYRGRDQRGECDVIVKCLRHSANRDESERFSREYFHAKDLQTLVPNRFAEIFDTVEMTFNDSLQQGPYKHALVLPYYQGGTLAEYTESPDKRLGIEDILRLTEQIAHAMHNAYGLHPRSDPGSTPRRFIHRDLKPSNIFLEEEITHEGVTRISNVRIGDFGSAKFQDGEASRTTEVLFVTEGYAAPELSSGVSMGDNRSDVYSIGKTILALLQIPPTDTVHSVREWVTGAIDMADTGRVTKRDLINVICKAIDAEPQYRYKDCGQLA
ncbi:MAG: protein kinase, partial [Planctomycetota bacterium]